jgi:hypothetical protein
MKNPIGWLAVPMFTLLAGAALTAPVATAQSNENAFMEVSERMDVGGTILEPGQYRITVVPLQENRNMLQVRNEDGSVVYATVLSINHPSMEKLAVSRFDLYATPVGALKALRTWFPAEVTSGGHDVVYPRERALELARLVREPVPAYVAEAPVTPEKLRVVEVKPVVVQAVAQAPAPPPPPVLLAEARLPATASRFPLVAGLGLLALVGAAGLTVIGRRIG